MTLPTEVEASYIVIIDDILAKSDLNTISAKRIRKGLQAQVGTDISNQKEDINTLIGLRFDKFNADRNGTATAVAAPEPAPSVAPTIETPAPTEVKIEKPTNGVSKSPEKTRKRSEPEPDDDALSSTEISAVESPPPKKKRVIEQSQEESDEAYAKRLQAELNRLGVGRSTRGGGRVSKKPLKKSKAVVRKQKSAKKVNSDDDSELESGDGEKKEVKRTGGFHKPMNLSQPLAELLGETQLSRPQTVKQIWGYIKQRDLQDPNDKRQIICDDAMRRVFKSDKVHMFTMNKVLGENLYAVDE